MNTINQFYVMSAVYKIESGGRETALLLNYAENSYKLIGASDERIDEIAKQLLSKKHAVNFAYKFNDKIEEQL